MKTSKASNENGVTFHSVDSRPQEASSPEYVAHEETGGVNSTVLGQQIISRGDTPECIIEKVEKNLKNSE